MVKIVSNRLLNRTIQFFFPTNHDIMIIISKIKLRALVRRTSKIGKINFTFRSFLLFDQATQISSLIRVSKFQVPSFGNGCRVPRRSRNPRQRHQTRISTIKFLP